MPHWLIALLKIAGMFLVMLAGWLARRRGYLDPSSTSALSRLVADVTLPALILDQMLTTVDAPALSAGWYVPLLGCLTIAVAHALGFLAAPWLAEPRDRATFVFVAGISNWVYLPLPIAEALFGEAGRLNVLLYNVGGLAMLWTLGVWTLQGGRPNLTSLRALLLNPGLIATFGGAALSLLVPSLRALTQPLAPGAPAAIVGGHVVFEAVRLVGSVTIPLSLLITGAQMGGLSRTAGAPPRAMAGIVALRLGAAPLAMIGLGALAGLVGWRPPDVTRWTVYLIAGMPVALNCAVLAERFGGDTALASRSIFVTTLLSLGTAPALLFLVQRLRL